LGLKNVFQAQLGHADDLVGQQVKRKRDRAARRALAALIARQQILPADIFDLLDEIAVNGICRKSSSHAMLRGKRRQNACG
jgi:cell division protein FtsB